MVKRLIKKVHAQLRRLGNAAMAGMSARPRATAQTPKVVVESKPVAKPPAEVYRPGQQSGPEGSERKQRPPRRRRHRQKTATPQERSPVSQTAGPIPMSGWTLSDYPVEPMEGKTRFHDLDLPVEIMRAVSDLEFKYCTPIQAAILPHLLARRDAAGRAQTGTGKTAAFLISILTRLLRESAGSRASGTPRALILAPTRELVIQIAKEAQELGRYCPFRIMAVFGGMDYKKQMDELSRGPVDIMVATPGRLLDFKQQRRLHLSKVEMLVIDEADRMLDMGFIPDVRSIIHSLPPAGTRQTMLFSATLTPEVMQLASRWTQDPVKIEVEPEKVAVDSVRQVIYIVSGEEKFTVLYNLLLREQHQPLLVFANRRDEAQGLMRKLSAHGLTCALLSGAVPQEKRLKTLQAFREGRVRVVVATDVAGRGIHVEGIGYVVNYHLPHDPEDYVHRIGRTGRAGATGTAVSFACEEDSFFIPEIEKYVGASIPCTFPEEELLKSVPTAHYKPESAPRPHRGPPRGRRPGGRPGGRRR